MLEGRFLIRGSKWASCCAMLAMMAGGASAQSLHMRFDVFVSGLRVMKVEFNGEISRTSYQGVADIKPKGLAGLFMKKRIHMEVQGQIRGRHAQPKRFFIHTRKKHNEKSATVLWKAARTITWTRNPPASPARRKAIAGAIAAGAIDPLSMLFEVGLRDGANPCAGSMRVFNGLVAFDIRLSRLATERIASGSFTGRTLKCRMVYVPVAGMSEEKKQRDLRHPPVFTVWLARLSGENGPLYVPVQATGRSKGRPFTASLREASLGGKPLSGALK